MKKNQPRNLITLLVVSLFFIGCDTERVSMSDVHNAQELYDYLKGKSILEVRPQFKKDSLDGINLLFEDNRTLLIEAIINENIEQVKLLLELSADPNEIPNGYEGKSAMAWATAYHNDKYLKLLLEHRGDPNLRNISQRTMPYPIYVAIMTDRTENLKLLLKAGANSNVVDGTGLTPAMLAATSGSWEMVMLLIEAGADVHFKNERGGNLLSLIEMVGAGVTGREAPWRAKVVNYLRKKGMKVNLRIPLE